MRAYLTSWLNETLLSGESPNERLNVAINPELAERLLSNLDPFDNSLVAEYSPQIEQKAIYGVSDLRDIASTVAGGEINGSSPEITLNGMAEGDEAQILTSDRGRYVAGAIGVPGLGIRIERSPVDANSGAEWGYFDSLNGFGFGIDNSGLYTFVKRSGAIVRKAYQSDWLLDSLDGTGPSGISIDPSDGSVFRFPFLWYGYGSIRFDVVNRTLTRDKTVTADVASFKGEVSIDNPNLPVAAKIWGNCKLALGGRQYGSYGRYTPKRRIVGAVREGVSVGTTDVPLVSFRLRSDVPVYESISVKLQGVEILTTDPIIWGICYNPTLTGASFETPAGFAANETATEYDISATAKSGGQKIYTALAQGGSGNRLSEKSIDLPSLDAPPNAVITLCAKSISGTSTVTAILRDRQEW